MDWSEQLLAVGTALAAGLLIGIERGWKLRKEPEGARVAGVRTFTLLGLLAGIAGMTATQGYGFVAGALIAAPAATLAIGYGRGSRRGAKADATSAVAGFVTLGLGFTAGIGNPGLAIAGASLVTLVLALRSEAHTLIGRLEEADVKALARYAVIALAVLPFLPSGTYGPYGAWNLQELWLVVILVTGFSFAGYAANRIFGARHGTIATAIIGGAYSSTAVTYSFAQRLGAGEGGGAENAGIALASAIMYLRVIVLVAALATPILIPFATLITPPLIVGTAASLWICRRANKSVGPAPPGNPIALIPALTFLLFVAVTAVAARWAEARFGEQGVAVLILIMGSMDVDAAVVTIGGLEPDAIAPQLAAIALGGTVLINMAVKLGVTLAYARGRASSAALALGASLVALAASLAGAWAIQ
jgi:uncharacterized membrane protein (DUF4010 family)